jgi:Acetyl-CoA hydrolase/transferase C-terminal domain
MPGCRGSPSRPDLLRFIATLAAMAAGRQRERRGAARPAGLRPGGGPDFVEGAAGSAGGPSIVALPATAGRGSLSRIVARVESVTIPGAQLDAAVTEFGV